jgi:Domain of unknown function (DUF4430)
VSRLLTCVIIATLALVAGGCGFGPGEAKKGPARLRVTRDFGRADLHVDGSKEAVRESDTVMRFLQGEAKVTTRYGGAFVQSIDGLAGNQTAERDWFYYVNGSEASVGASDYKLSPGDVVQWDYHNWHATQHIPAIVGAYPEPFVHGLKGKRLPARLECEDDSSSACNAVTDALDKEGVTVTNSAIGSPASDKALRVVVAKFSVAKQLGAARALTLGPATSGVYARFDSAGRTLTFLDTAGHASRVAPPGTGLLAATQQPSQPITWLVTGVDDSGVERAAHALRASSLRDAFAVAVTPSAVLRLPG